MFFRGIIKMAGGANPQQTQAPMGQPQPMQAQGGTPNVYDQSAGAYNAALGGTQQAMAGPNIGAFMNPYQNMVTGQALGDLERQRQMATNAMDAQAGQAGAFGGSRHGVAQGAQQMLIDSAKGQFDGYSSAPINALQTRMASTGAANMGQNTSTQKKNPGLFDYLSLGASFAGG